MKQSRESISAVAMPRITRTEIVCGDCAGDELLPVRTRATMTGECDNCGGRSFVLASVLCGRLAFHRRLAGAARAEPPNTTVDDDSPPLPAERSNQWIN